MTAIRDSSAFSDDARMLPQHQAALTLLQARLMDPSVAVVRWLDLACGKGQILVGMGQSLSPAARAKIRYTGYDVEQDYARQAHRYADKLGFDSCSVSVGALHHFAGIIDADCSFDFVTLTNTVHEVSPSHLASLLVDGMLCLANHGTLFVYDLERIVPPELGAIPWKKDEIGALINSILSGLGCVGLAPEVGSWIHKTTTAWNFQIRRELLGVSATEARTNRDRASTAAEEMISVLLRDKLKSCAQALESLTQYGAETPEEQLDRDQLLHNFWALSRAVETYR